VRVSGTARKGCPLGFGAIPPRLPPLRTALLQARATTKKPSEREAPTIEPRRNCDGRFIALQRMRLAFAAELKIVLMAADEALVPR